MLYQILVFITHGETKNSYNNNKFKISAPPWNDKFELPDGSYSVSDIQDYFEYILEKHGEDIDEPSDIISHTYIQSLTLDIKIKMYT